VPSTSSALSRWTPGPLDLAAVQDWIGELLQKKGTDMYRMKGVLNVRFSDQKFVYHAVHMIFNGEFEDWEPEEPRGNKLVFIGKNLDAAALRAGFSACLATPENLEKKMKELRFKVGDRVECNMSGGMREKGTVVALMWRDDDMEKGQVCPYKVKLDSGGITWAPFDEDECIRKVEDGPDSKRQRAS